MLLATTLLAMVASNAVAVAQEEKHNGAIGRFDRPFDGFAPSWTRLHDAKPEWIGLDPAPISASLNKIADWTKVNPATGIRCSPARSR